MIRLCGALFAAMLLAAECRSVPEIREGKLDIIATDLTGQQLDDVTAELFSGNDRIAEASPGTRVRYGDYQLRVYAPGFHAQWREICISQPETVVRVELPVGTECATPTATIGGKVNLKSSSGDLWVKVIPVRGSGGGEARVNSSGYFMVSGLEQSTYVVLRHARRGRPSPSGCQKPFRQARIPLSS